MKKLMHITAALALMTGPALAGNWSSNAPDVSHLVGSPVETPIYAYNGSTNYCPAGFQPISISGVICCGQPNQAQSYQSMFTQASSSPRRSRVVCPVGEKGCYTN